MLKKIAAITEFYLFKMIVPFCGRRLEVMRLKQYDLFYFGLNRVDYSTASRMFV